MTIKNLVKEINTFLSEEFQNKHKPTSYSIEVFIYNIIPEKDKKLIVKNDVFMKKGTQQCFYGVFLLEYKRNAINWDNSLRKSLTFTSVHFVKGLTDGVVEDMEISDAYELYLERRKKETNAYEAKESEKIDRFKALIKDKELNYEDVKLLRDIFKDKEFHYMDLVKELMNSLKD